MLRLSQYVVDDVTMHVGESEISSLMTIRELFVINSEKM